MKLYDVIVIGCNISSLISAISLLNDGYKVLLIDKRNTIGEIINTIRLGRYTFNTEFNNMYLRNNTFNYSLNKILSNCGIKDRLEYKSIDNLCNIKIKDNEYVLPFGIDMFINYLDSKISDSKDKLDSLFKIAIESRDVLDYIVNNLNNIDFNYVKKEYKDFYNICDLSLEDGLSKLEINGELKEILTKFSIYFGVDSNSLSFVEYLVFLVNIVERGVQINRDNLLELLLNDYISRDGNIRLKTNVVSLIIDEDCINGVRLSTGEVIYTEKVVVDGDIANVYGNMIEAKDVPRIALKHINKVDKGNKVFSIYLGLNIDLKDMDILGNNYIFDNMIISIDTQDEVSVMSIQYILKDNVFIESVNTRNYNYTIDRMTKKILDEIQSNLNIKIYENIEEIKVITPFEQDIFSTKLNMNESILAKILNSNNERYIKGLYVCDGLNGDIYGYRSNIMSGLNVINYYKNEGDLSEKN